jgi:vacuolar-type H+-ATPase subunit E/Vma4
MKSVEENIDMLSRALLSEANAEAEQILADARAKAEAIREHAQKQAASERAEILARANQEAERLRGQAIATTQLKSRTLLMDEREKLIDKVFQAAREQIGTVAQWSDYDAIAMRLLREAAQQLRVSQVNVRADANTEKVLSDQELKAVSDELKVLLKMTHPLQKGTGIVVETTNGHMHYDNTLENRLNRLQNALRSPVYRLLMGEPL